MPVANIQQSLTIFEDVANGSNPLRKHVDWKRSATGLTFSEVYSERFIVKPGVTRTIETPAAVTDLSATPVTLAPLAAKPTWYQVRGSFPSSPWALPLAVATQPATLTPQVDGSMLLSGAGVASIAAVHPADLVYLAGAAYGDIGSFGTINQGFWVVKAVGSLGVYLTRLYLDDTQVAETVTIAGTTDIQHIPFATMPTIAYIEATPAFSGLKVLMGVAIGWVAIPGEVQFTPQASATLTKLTLAARHLGYVRVEADAPVSLAIGDLAQPLNTISLQPLPIGVPGWHESFGLATSLAVTNKGPAAATVNLVYGIF